MGSQAYLLLNWGHREIKACVEGRRMGRGDDLVAVLLKGGLVLQVGAARRQAARLGVDVQRAVYAVQHWLPLQRCAH